MDPVIIVAIIVVVVLLIIGGVLLYGMMSPTPVATATPTIGGGLVDDVAPTPAASPGRTYTFYQGKDSNFDDIKNVTELANNIPELKKACDATPNCAGFNTNAWLKHTIKPQNQWYNWTRDPTKGLYVANSENQKFTNVEKLINWG